MNAVSILLILPVVLIAGLLHWLPLWRRSSLWFAVTVGPDFRNSPEARRVLRGYRVAVWVSSLAALILVWIGIQDQHSWMVLTGELLQVSIAIAAFAIGRNRIRPFAVGSGGMRSAPLWRPAERFPGGIAGAAIPYGMLAVAAGYLYLNWQRIPARFPTHWGMSGAPDSWGGRNWRSVFGPLLAGTLIISLLQALGYMMLRGSPRARMAETAEWTARFRRANLRMVVAMSWTMSALFGIISLTCLSSGDQMPIPAWLMVGVVLAVTVGFLWPIIRISQEPGSGSDGTPDDCWKLGQIYYNPDDPALMVEKRFGVGYTINFGNRASWLVMALLVLVIFVPILL